MGSDVIVVSRAEELGPEPRDARIEVRLAVDAESASNFYAGFSDNVSECGVFVATDAPLNVGSTVELWISLPHKAPIRTRGTVRWQRRNTASSEKRAGMGIRFDRLSYQDSAHIQEFAEARAPIFFDDEHPEGAERATLRP